MSRRKQFNREAKPMNTETPVVEETQNDIGRGLTTPETFVPEEDLAPDLKASLGLTHLTDEQFAEFEEQGGLDKGQTALGNWVVDPSRATRPVSEWSNLEQIDAVNHRLENVTDEQIQEAASILDNTVNEEQVQEEVAKAEYDQNTSVEELLALIKTTENNDTLAELVSLVRAKSEEIPLAFTVREAVDFVKQGIVPAKTSNGVWVNSVVRNKQIAHDWPTPDLIAWAMGEVKETQIADDRKLALELRDRFNLPTKSSDPKEIVLQYKAWHAPVIENTKQVKLVDAEETPVENVTVIREGLTEMNQTYIQYVLNHYAEEVKVGRSINVDRGYAAQKELDNLFQYVISLEDPRGFANAMDMIYEFVSKNRSTLFNDTYAFRFTGGIPNINNRQDAHKAMLNLFMVFTGEKDILAQTDIHSLVKAQPTDKQQLILAYFKRHLN